MISEILDKSYFERNYRNWIIPKFFIVSNNCTVSYKTWTASSGTKWYFSKLTSKLIVSDGFFYTAYRGHLKNSKGNLYWAKTFYSFIIYIEWPRFRRIFVGIYYSEMYFFRTSKKSDTMRLLVIMCRSILLEICWEYQKIAPSKRSFSKTDYSDGLFRISVTEAVS